MPESFPETPQAQIVTALNEVDLAALTEWTSRHENIGTDHLRSIGGIAMQHEAQLLYAIVTEKDPADGRVIKPSRFVALTGPDAGTVLKNDPEIFQRFGLPTEGPAVAYEALSDDQKSGGAVRNYNPYYGTEVQVRRSNGDIDSGWQVINIKDDGRAVAIKNTAKGMLRKVVAIESINPKIEAPAKLRIVKSDEAQNSPEELRVRRLSKLFSLPTTEQREDPNVAKRFVVTEKSQADAAYAYRFADENIKTIFTKYKTSDAWRETDMPELVRTNSELRLEIGDYILQKIQAGCTRLASRVYSDHGKTVNHYGYNYVGSMDSKEAVTQLALSMLDGTYKIDDCGNDKIELNSWGEAVQGQHRWSAYNILGTPLSAYEELIR